ncbi:MAG TPA: PilT/PilU family type 4a pilus ATPase [Tepidisphaeraceae bacterium]|nr:PilT/PilU family type 4a pilus ATPase [Tepidisphaeraceae bacterium]
METGTLVSPTPAAAPAAPSQLNQDIQQPQIRIEERRFKLLDFLNECIRTGGSDVHLQALSVPMIRINGVPHFLSAPPITDEQMHEYVGELIRDENKRQMFEKDGAVDLAYFMPDKSARFRTNIFHSRERFAIVMRRIVTKIPNFEELALPPSVEKLADHFRGLVVVSGTTGSGKSTTLAAIIGKINRTRCERIITVEDPVEYQHENAKSLVSQIEVGTDSKSYEFALREMMRQDPDSILIGEIRDSFSLTTALRAADTGHLVFTTVHATNAPMTVERLVSLFDPESKLLQQAQLGMNLVAVMCQRLAKRRDGKGRVPVVELMIATPLVRKYILEGEFDKLKGTVGNRESGSQSFDQHLTELFNNQIIDVAEAKRLASNVDALNLALRGISNSDTKLK